jgi:hypothetical protein
MGWDAWLREEFAPESVAQGYIGIEPLEWNDEWLRTDRIIDIRPSKAFKTSRLKGSTWIPRSHFNSLSLSNRYLIVCDHSQITHTQALVNALNLSKSNCITWDVIPTEHIDSYAISFENHPVDEALFFPDRHQGNLEDAQGYLDWEHSLLPTLRDHGDIPWKPINDPLDQPTSHLTTFYRQVHS